jgi:hypothetical protein
MPIFRVFLTYIYYINQKRQPIGRQHKSGSNDQGGNKEKKNHTRKSKKNPERPIFAYERHFYTANSLYSSNFRTISDRRHTQRC